MHRERAQRIYLKSHISKRLENKRKKERNKKSQGFTKVGFKFLKRGAHTVVGIPSNSTTSTNHFYISNSDQNDQVHYFAHVGQIFMNFRFIFLSFHGTILLACYQRFFCFFTKVHLVLLVIYFKLNKTDYFPNIQILVKGFSFSMLSLFLV